MKKLVLIVFVLSCGILPAQTDTLLGKWKFAGSDQKKVDAALPYEKFSPGSATPKYEYIEFKPENECLYNEEQQDEDAGGEYTVAGNKLTLNGAVYKIKYSDKDHLSLSREMYYYVAEGKKVLVRKEELSFKRIF
jgi:hypothetical protein